MNETTVTIHGNLVADPERRSGRTGDFTTFRVAVNERWYDKKTQAYVDGPSSFYNVRAFRTLGEHVHKSLHSGAAVIVTGFQRINRWQTSSGEPRETIEIDAHNVGPDLKWGIATFQRVRTHAEEASGWGDQRSDRPQSDSSDVWSQGAPGEQAAAVRQAAPGWQTGVSVSSGPAPDFATDEASALQQSVDGTGDFADSGTTAQDDQARVEQQAS
ncbi:single-stranded DNA-binding protein [Flexivirga sp. ID2601S]|uniref:Single-stranded DNA-binding protein n=1 Tax=Flexivirga aerilata TaxID=1656889 RepID=A0A849AJC7_9MICO|nr:single-stranded DNA-binding protein [Flexivirga aerilata]NNG39431.1 single-stranded DNA-binding protein [Flexivirga aerilata]